MFVPCNALISSWLTAYPNATPAQKAAFCGFVNDCVSGDNLTIVTSAPTAPPTGLPLAINITTTPDTMYWWDGSAWAQVGGAGGGGATLGAGAPSGAPAPGGSNLYVDISGSPAVVYAWNGSTWTTTAGSNCPAAGAPTGVLAKAYGLTAAGACAVEDVVIGDSLDQQFDAIPAGTIASFIGRDAAGAPVQQPVGSGGDTGNLGPGIVTGTSLGAALTDGIGVDCTNNALQQAVVDLVAARRTTDLIDIFREAGSETVVPAGTYPVGSQSLQYQSADYVVTNPASSCRDILVTINMSAASYAVGPAAGDPSSYLPILGVAQLVTDGVVNNEVYSRTDHVAPGESSRGSWSMGQYHYVVSPGVTMTFAIRAVYKNPNQVPQVIEAGAVYIATSVPTNVYLVEWI